MFGKALDLPFQISIMCKLLDKVLLVILRVINDLHQLQDILMSHFLINFNFVLNQGRLCLSSIYLSFGLIYHFHSEGKLLVSVPNLFDN